MRVPLYLLPARGAIPRQTFSHKIDDSTSDPSSRASAARRTPHVAKRTDPIERLVLTSLLEGLGELQHPIEIGQTSDLLAHPPRGINANIRDAIWGLKPPLRM